MPAAVTKPSLTNNVCWYLLNNIFLRYGVWAIFVYMAFVEWKWHPSRELIAWFIVVTVFINFFHKYFGHIIGFYMLAIYHLDHIYALRLIKIFMYAAVYFLAAKPKKLIWLSVYLPVAHSWTGILTSKLYGYQTRGLIKEFTFLLVPLLIDLFVEEKELHDEKPFIYKYSRCLFFIGVILLGFITLLIPRVVPPRKEKTGTRVLGAWALDDDDIVVNVPAPADDDVLAPVILAPAVPPPPPVVIQAIQADPVAARLIAADESVRATIAADSAVVAAVTAFDAAHEIVVIAASVVEAATALQTADPDHLATYTAAANAVAASDRAVAAEIAAVTVVGTAVAAAAAAADAAAAEPGRWGIYSMAKGWGNTIGQNARASQVDGASTAWLRAGGIPLDKTLEIFAR